jgi:hypothetical protein
MVSGRWDDDEGFCGGNGYLYVMICPNPKLLM